MDLNTYNSTIGLKGTQQSDSGLLDQTDAYSQLDMGNFVELMIAELTNQDPLNPMDNSEMMAQLTQMSAIDSNRKLSSTLSSILLGQNLATAGTMIGKEVHGMNAAGQLVTGLVDRVSIENGSAMLHIGNETIDLNNLAEIRSKDEGSSVYSAELIGSTILGMSDAGEQVVGVVDRITMENGETFVHVGSDKIRMSNVNQVMPAGTIMLPDGTIMEGSSLMDKAVLAQGTNARPVLGAIDSINVSQDGITTVQIGEHTLTLDRIEEIVADPSKVSLGKTVNLPDGSVGDIASLFGRTVTGVADSGSEITGMVTCVTGEAGQARLYVDGKSIWLNNVTSVE